MAGSAPNSATHFAIPSCGHQTWLCACTGGLETPLPVGAGTCVRATARPCLPGLAARAAERLSLAGRTLRRGARPAAPGPRGPAGPAMPGAPRGLLGPARPPPGDGAARGRRCSVATRANLLIHHRRSACGRAVVADAGRCHLRPIQPRDAARLPRRCCPLRRAVCLRAACRVAHAINRAGACGGRSLAVIRRVRLAPVAAHARATTPCLKTRGALGRGPRRPAAVHRARSVVSALPFSLMLVSSRREQRRVLRTGAARRRARARCHAPASAVELTMTVTFVDDRAVGRTFFQLLVL